MIRPLFAIAKITHNVDGEMLVTGEYDHQGNQIIKAVSKHIEAHRIFDASIFPNDEIDRLFAAEAVREVNESELALVERIAAS